MSKTHFKYIAADARGRGQTDYEYSHQTACGYVRKNVTSNPDDVNCSLCLESGRMSITDIYCRVVEDSPYG